MKRREFIAMVSDDLATHGIHFQCVAKGSLHKKYAGWFDASSRKLVLARQHRDFFANLLHEYCHFRHWLEDRQDWNRQSRRADVFFEWLHTRQSSNRKPLAKKIINAKNAAQQLEYDCERRSLAMIKKYQLPIDVREYAQKANAYLLSYHLMAYYHRWPDKKSVYSASICQLMPVKLLPLGRICSETTLTEAMRQKMQGCFSL